MSESNTWLVKLLLRNMENTAYFFLGDRSSQA